MANQQQVLFAETIAGMKKALKRRAYESDSDSDVDANGNRGQKLKKKARFARRGQLVPTGGPSSYKETVEYAGVRRSILHRNPPLLDEEGYEVESDDDPDRVEDAIAAAAEFDPYANIRLENVLAPLTATTDLPTHPTLSKPFTSEILNDLVSKSCQMMRKENQSLWQVRHLWTTLCGDQTWAPCELMIGPNDVELFTEDHVARHLLSLSRNSTGEQPNAKSPPATNGDSATNNGESVKPGSSAAEVDGDVSMADGTGSRVEDAKGGAKKEGSSTKKPLPNSPKPESEDTPMQNGDTAPAANKETTSAETEGQSSQDAVADRTRLQVQLTSESAALTAPEEAENTFVHPIFITPDGARADRDIGLADQEADQLRKLLALYVQKQEEVCRGAEKLHEGLLKAQRLRADVLHWSKAEAHSGPNRDMSDGEDWYDREEWGLTEDLKKGQDEEEEDTTTTGRKTTRARR